MVLPKVLDHDDEVEALRSENEALRAELASLRRSPDLLAALCSSNFTDDSTALDFDSLPEDLRLLTDALPQMLWLTRADGYFKFFNRPWWRYTGLSYEQAIGEGWPKILHPEDYQSSVQRWQHCLATGEAYEAVYRLRRGSDGMFRWFLAKAVPRRSQSGEILEWCGICIDIHEHKSNEAALEQAKHHFEQMNSAKDQFLATVSHELRTPLSAILGWTQLMQIGRLSEQEQQRSIAAIHENARTQIQLIEDILDVTRIIENKLRLELSQIEARALIASVIAMMEPIALQKNIVIHFHAINEEILVCADAGRLQQIVWNLISNAIKFSAVNSEIYISLKRRGKELVFQVKDYGKGIQAEKLSLIFERFRQLDDSSSRENSGLGLGLAIVKHLVELHGGSIQVASPGLGKGTTFTICLPAVLSKRVREERIMAEIPLSNRQAAADALRGISCLIVDSDSRTREMLKSMLEHYQALVITAKSVSEAIVVLENMRPDVLVCVIGHSYQNKYDLIQYLRQISQKKGGDIPALALSSSNNQVDRQSALDLGFDQFAVKPVSPEDLIAMVLELSALRHANCKNLEHQP